MHNTLEEMKSPKKKSEGAGTRTVIAPKESITHENTEKFEARFRESLDKNKTEIILDLKTVSLIDSAALQMLLQIHGELQGRGGRLCMVGLNAVCKDILIATRLINVFHVYEDLHDAIASRP